MDMHNTKAGVGPRRLNLTGSVLDERSKSITQELNRRDGKHNKKVSWALTFRVDHAGGLQVGPQGADRP